MPTLDELESRFRDLLEIQLLRYLPGFKAEDRVYQQLAAALHNNLKEQDGIVFAPNLYVIIAHPSTLSRWQTAPRLLVDLAQALRTAGVEAGYRFQTNPTVSTAADKDQAVDETHIIASFSSEAISETHGRPASSKPAASGEAIPANAFLILTGTKIIPLNQAVINIGRRLDNQIVLEDPRVSRTHAQLRIVRGRYILFDLESSGGTYVNGQRIHQSILYPGDVISLAGLTLIFGQDLPSGRNPGKLNTHPIPVISSDRPTAILRESEYGKLKKARKI